VEGFIAIAESLATIGKTLNIGSGTETSIRELIQIIFDLTGAKCEVDLEQARVRPEASEVDRLCADSFLLNQLTGWSPRVPLRDGLKRTIEWISQNLDAYPTGSYVV
jgi:dTDP-glucose 4,6-dehydratase